MEHLSLEIFDTAGTGSKYAVLPENTSITITDTSEIFASGDVWSYSFQLNVFANAHIFGTSGDIRGSRLHEQINKRRARLWVEGIPMYLGYLKLDDEVDVGEDGDVDVIFESGQKTFEQKIEGAKANQVPMMNDVPIGMALWRERGSYHYLQMKARGKIGSLISYDGEGMMDLGDESLFYTPWVRDHWDVRGVGFTVDGNYMSVQRWPRMVYPKGVFSNPKTTQSKEINCLNTDSPYMEDENGTPTHPYCNIALCYQKYGYQKKNEVGDINYDYSGEPEAEREYELMPANRVNSAPNFFVIYWLRSLMHYLGIHIDENQMMDVEDLRRLFFVNTKCSYKEVKHTPDSGVTFYEEEPSHPVFSACYERAIMQVEESGLKVDELQVDGPHVVGSDGQHDFDPSNWQLEKVLIDVVSDQPSNYERIEFHEAMASSDCFPNVDISEVIKGLESGFGIRLLFSDNYQRVRIILLRNIFRSKDTQNIECDIESVEKVENSTRGFRMTYGNTEDTHFYYKGFADKLPHKKELWPDTSDTHDYSKWGLNEEYSNLYDKVSAFNKTCYVTPKTGNAYGVKIDKEAKRYDDLHPSLFEFAGFMDAKDGDCTGEEETIETINVGFTPIIMNDLNYKKEKDKATTEQRFALFVDEKMRPRRPDLGDGVDYNDADAAYYVPKGSAPAGRKALYDDNSPAANMKKDGIVKPGEFAIASDAEAPLSASQLAYPLKARITFYSPWPQYYHIRPRFVYYDVTFGLEGHINEGYRLYLQDNYEPNDDGVSPIETHEWGLTLGIMRGSGSDSRVDYNGDPDDAEGNDTWEVMPGSGATAHPDTCDCYGREWDYNGEQEGIGDTDGRISLKLRAEKPNPYFDPKQPESENNRRYLEIEDENLRRRGIADQFYKEYSYWVRNARICKMQVAIGIAQLQNIDKTKRVKIGDITGFVRKMQYSVSKQTGLGLVTMEIMYI